MKVDLTQTYFGATATRDTRTQNSPARMAFSTALRDAAQLNFAVQISSKSLPASPSQSTIASPSLQFKPQQSFNERALGLRAYRQELLASNIANADTPGYKSVDIDVNDALRTGKSKEEIQLQYRTPAQGSIDGNTVDMDVQRAQFSQNALMYEYSLDRVKGYYKMMDELLKGTPY